MKGSSTAMIILLVIIIGSILFVAGPFPRFSTLPQSGIDPTQQTLTNPRIATQSAGNNTNGLQLKTLDFQSCSANAAVDMELDVSGSMAQRTGIFTGNSKINNLKTAVKSFLGNMGDQSIIGIQTFDSVNPQRVLVPISLYKDVKGTINSKIDSLTPGGQTPTATALRFSEGVLKDAQAKYPDKKIVFIFVSDGLPVPTTQDPRNPSNAPNPADEIKKAGFTIYTIAVGKDSGLNNLMTSIASSPETAFQAPTSDELTKIYQQIGGKICQDAD